MQRDDAGDPCRPAWNAIGSRDFRAWAGLPEGCGYAALDAVFPRVAEAYGEGTLGERYQPATYRMHAVEGPPYGARVWFRGDRVVLVELEYPGLPHPSRELLQSLGEPQARLDAYVDVMPVPGGAWVYAARGITLFLDSGHTEVMRVALYHPCTPEEYADGLHPRTERWELPLSEAD
ncbi:MAG TPA: hypothetical protein VFJ82_08380 [Longimicrobium sp.]|nr:hypothetical protein [Longimicrobium sp.]